MQYFFSSGAPKQAKRSYGMLMILHLHLNVRQVATKVFKIYFCHILINIGGERPSAQIIFCTPKFNF